ncbi:MAG: hypothetical protein HN926_02045 [Chloroflexi bacterium]|nr:hypothetical protein [Chloroflexota bacterium]MBT3864249.1 hypothetical protein [Chloroflexota bacterium]MBT4141658.1 hypothetical protein [Chloroflexota bacterium]MBT4942509.1 hypothetical protein [Chloroflexota bacterium]MBT5477310.1 hypothetical protein [Chloroflexota bacterium]
MANLRSASPINSGGIKPLNAPRTVYVRTDSAGNPTSIQVPPAIGSPRYRRNHRGNPHPNPLTTRDMGHDRPKAEEQPTLLSDGKWTLVAEIDDIWKINDEWWRGPDEEIARLYYVLRLGSGQKLSIYLDLATNIWYRQAG